VKIKSDKVAGFIYKKILPSDILPSILIFSSGAFLFYIFINDKKTSGLPALIIIGITYLLLGIGLYGIFKWVGIRVLLLIVLFFRLIFKGEVQVTFDGHKWHSKLIFK